MVSGFHLMANNDFKPLNFFPFHSEKRPTFHSCSEVGCPHEIIGFSHCWLLQLVGGAGTKGLCPLCVLFVREEDIFWNRFPTSLWPEQGQMATTKPITGWIYWDCHCSVRQAKSPRVTHRCLNKTRVCGLGSDCLGRFQCLWISIITAYFNNVLSHQC